MNNGLQIAYVAVGSNISPRENIPSALEILMRKLRVTGTSRFFQTPAIGRPGQDDYLNGVWQVLTDVEPLAMKFGILRPIETELGRVRVSDKYVARPIDLDLILWGDTVVDDGEVVLPAPEIFERDFIQAALADFAAEFTADVRRAIDFGKPFALKADETLGDILQKLIHCDEGQ